MEKYLDIFKKMDHKRVGKPTNRMQYFKELAPGGPYQCLITGRKMDAETFRQYQRHSPGGSMDFTVKLFNEL